MASGDSVDGIVEIEDPSRGRNDGKTEAVDDESDEEEKGKGMTRGKVPSPLDMTESRSLAGGGPKTPPGISRHRSERERKLGHRRVGVGGEITYKKIQSTQIMGSIQLGIQHAVGGLASKPERDLLMQDFMTVETTIFDTEGSNHTPAHHYSDFKFKTYAPIAFRYFRDLFGIQPDDFLISMCSAPLRELSNPGASGSIFYLTSDDEFIVKTVQHKEGEFLQKLLPGYYMNLNQNPRTLLPKFFGLYCYQCNSKNVRLVAMNNLLPSVIKLHQKYDLKGSTYKRKASKTERTKSSPTFKDLDFIDHHPEGIFLEADTYSALVKTIQRDCRVLESFKIMDYSLLVGIHNLDQAAREKAEKRTQERQDKGEGSGAGGSSGEGGSGAGADSGDDKGSTSGAGALNRSRSINRQRLVAHSTAMESIQAESEPIDEEEDVPPGGIPARNAKGERLLMFLGIIDILQSYRLKKKLEHTWKSMIHDGDTVSVHRPGFYAQRFQDFMAKTVFKKIPSRLMQSPHHAGSKPASPTAAQQTVGLTTPKLASVVAAVSSSGPSGLPQGTSPPTSTSSPAQPVVPSTTITSSPPTTTVHYPAVLKGRPLGVGTAGSPAGPGTTSSGKSRVPPPVPPRSPKRPHHGQQQGSVRQGSRSSHRPRAEEDRGGALTGPGALINPTARTSNFLSPLNQCSSPNSPSQIDLCDHLCQAIEAHNGYPRCPPRRSHPSSSKLKSFGAVIESPIVPPRRNHRTSGKDIAGNEKLSDELFQMDSGENVDSSYETAQANASVTASHEEMPFLRDESNIENLDYPDAFEEDEILECSRSQILLISSKQAQMNAGKHCYSLGDDIGVVEKTGVSARNLCSLEKQFDSECELEYSSFKRLGRGIEETNNTCPCLEEPEWKSRNGEDSENIAKDGNDSKIKNSAKYKKESFHNETSSENIPSEAAAEDVRPCKSPVEYQDDNPSLSEFKNFDGSQKEDSTLADRTLSPLPSDLKKFSEQKNMNSQNDLFSEMNNSQSRFSSVNIDDDGHLDSGIEHSTFVNISERPNENAVENDELVSIRETEIPEAHDISKSNSEVFCTDSYSDHAQEFDEDFNETSSMHDSIQLETGLIEGELSVAENDTDVTSPANHLDRKLLFFHEKSHASMSSGDEVKVRDIIESEEQENDCNSEVIGLRPLPTSKCDQSYFNACDKGAQMENEDIKCYNGSFETIKSSKSVFTIQEDISGYKVGDTSLVKPLKANEKNEEIVGHIHPVTGDQNITFATEATKVVIDGGHSTKEFSYVHPMLLHSNAVPKPFVRSIVHDSVKHCQIRPVLAPLSSTSLGSFSNVSSKFSGYFDVEDKI